MTVLYQAISPAAAKAAQNGWADAPTLPYTVIGYKVEKAESYFILFALTYHPDGPESDLDTARLFYRREDALEAAVHGMDRLTGEQCAHGKVPGSCIVDDCQNRYR